MALEPRKIRQANVMSEEFFWRGAKLLPRSSGVGWVWDDEVAILRFESAI